MDPVSIPYLVLRVDGDDRDTHAVDYRGDLEQSLAQAMDLALPDPGSTVHVAIVSATDAGAARLKRVPHWIGADDDGSHNPVLKDEIARIAKALRFAIATAN